MAGNRVRPVAVVDPKEKEDEGFSPCGRKKKRDRGSEIGYGRGRSTLCSIFVYSVPIERDFSMIRAVFQFQVNVVVTGTVRGVLPVSFVFFSGEAGMISIDDFWFMV
ncbi:hypothetical protein L2E82_31569 [Cichorium intybus]|uniref:Uncharacterized protein n=1 Tax=Cichorium intybus TaxID=13427 RepID=A0ACB9BII5_CICIN|nr:hypothetical protein L2E82_31569 [Cichorium intybus]